MAHAGYRLDPPAFDALFKSFDPDRCLSDSARHASAVSGWLLCASFFKQTSRPRPRLLIPSARLVPPACRTGTLCLAEFLAMSVFLQVWVGGCVEGRGAGGVARLSAGISAARPWWQASPNFLPCALQGAARTFHAFDAQKTGRITLDFSQ